jgi:threonine/homoserine/homoserine lactone efflux protein
MSFAIIALTFGLVAGLKPGPLGVFVIHETLTKGLLRGFLASLAPLLTDGPIILLALYLSLHLNDFNWFISIISILGSLYLAYLAYKIYRTPKGINPNSTDNASGFFTAVKINLLNPSPYLFWLTIGSSYILLGTKVEAGIFIVCVLFSLCLTKYAVAYSIKVLGQRFNPRVYSMLLRSLALPLLLFSAQLMYSGVSLLTV